MVIPLLLFFSTSFGTVHASTTTPAAEHVLAASQATMGEYVRQYFADTPIMADIAWCESRDRQWNLDGTTFHGAVNHDDIGIMQINTAYHGTEAKQLGYDLYSLSGNMEFAKYLYAHEGTQPWSSSEACWGKLAAR